MIVHQAKLISISNHHMSLGHLISPKEPGRTQRSQLEDINDRFKGILQQEYLSVKGYEIIYRSIYIPTVQHVLQGSCMNDKEFYNVSQINKHLFLHKLRYSKTMVSDMVKGRPQLGGLGLLDF